MSDGNETLWRFMSTTKFVAMLTSGTLVFPQIASFLERDPLEGSLSYQPDQIMEGLSKKIRGAAFDREPHQAIWKTSDGKEFRWKQSAPKEMGEHTAHSNLIQQCVYASCWNSSKFEPAHLWSMYASEREGVAIRTTKTKLASCLKSNDFKLKARLVEYVDFDGPEISSVHWTHVCFRKRREYSAEQEFRVAFVSLPIDEDASLRNFQSERPSFVLKSPPKYYGLECDMRDMIQEVVVAPFAPSWVRNAVEGLADKFEIAANVTMSELGRKPI